MLLKGYKLAAYFNGVCGKVLNVNPAFHFAFSPHAKPHTVASKRRVMQMFRTRDRYYHHGGLNFEEMTKSLAAKQQARKCDGKMTHNK